MLGTFLRQDPTEGPCPGRAAAARPPLQWATRLTDFPEVCPVGTFNWAAPILQTPAAWMAPPSTNPASATASPRRLGLYLIGNELGHQSYQREALFRTLTQVYYRLPTGTCIRGVARSGGTAKLSRRLEATTKHRCLS